ncbi:hypothetical protein Tsubulata_035222 [Turnera subulata]|uniref:Clathrin light chain n=1 Tax=Turnera subulata TaxID=218843 RepID=A0A9Q0G7C4_9ROSI|nr:hypothetical protein Tsubulata_035222 [Turnera subulata]
MSTYVDSFDDSVPETEPTRHFDDDDISVGYNSQQFDSFAADGHGVFNSHPPPVYGAGDEEFSPEDNGEDFGAPGGPILPPPAEMAVEEGLALREWRRENAIRLEEKEKREKELLNQIIEEADEYKVEFYRKRETTSENNKTTNREKEKLFVAGHTKFHAEADTNYWKAIADLVPNEVPTIEKKGKKDQEKKPSIAVIQGPKPGKPTDLSRMRQILLKLKHTTPAHLKSSPTPPQAPAEGANLTDSAAASTSIKADAVGTVPEPVAVA